MKFPEWQPIEYEYGKDLYVISGETEVKLDLFMRHREELPNRLRIDGIYTWANCCSDCIMISDCGEAAIVGSYEQFKNAKPEEVEAILN